MSNPECSLVVHLADAQARIPGPAGEHSSMTQVVVQDFELESIPQARPRAAKHPIDKLAPQLTKGRFHQLPHLAEDKALRRGLVPSNQQHLRLFRQGRRAVAVCLQQPPASPDRQSEARPRDDR